MKKSSFAVYCLCAIVTLVIFAHCKKSGNTTTSTTTPTQTCQITGIQQTVGSQNTILSYDNQNRLISWHTSYINGSGATQQESEAFQYGPGYVVTTLVTAITIKDSLVLNSDGSISSDYFSDAVTTGLTTYSYSSNGELLTSVATSSGDSSPKTTIYSWANGDMVATSYGGTFSYDSTKKSVQGDETQLTQLLQYGTGAWTTKVAHQLTSEFIGFTVGYAYTYDSTGKVTSLTTQAAGSPSATQNFTYQCQ